MKEQHNCKIAFILNDGTMSEEDKESFRRHGEKIIDLELRFAPLPEEAFDYVFPKSHPHYDLVKACCLTLCIKNIRILQRVSRFTEGLLTHVEGSETKVVEDALRSLILYVWCHYDSDSSTPPLSYVLKFNHVGLLMRQQYVGEDESAEVKRWSDRLISYGYQSTDELNQHIASFVETGYLNVTPFSLELEKRNGMARAQQGDQSYAMAWDLYKNTFANNEQEFVHELAARFRSNVVYLSVADLQNTVEMLRHFEQDELANTLIDEYFERHAGDPTTVKMRRSAFLDELKDPYLVERLKAAWQPPADKRTLAEVVKELTSRNGWNSEDVELLATQNVDDYYNFFKSESSNFLYQYVRTCLKFGEFAGASEQHKAIAAKTIEALRRIASENRINKLRVSAIYKIAVDEKSTETKSNRSPS